jgi:hypothetical protein
MPPQLRFRGQKAAWATTGEAAWQCTFRGQTQLPAGPQLTDDREVPNDREAVEDDGIVTTLSQQSLVSLSFFGNRKQTPSFSGLSSLGVCRHSLQDVMGPSGAAWAPASQTCWLKHMMGLRLEGAPHSTKLDLSNVAPSLTKLETDLLLLSNGPEAGAGVIMGTI